MKIFLRFLFVYFLLSISFKLVYASAGGGGGGGFDSDDGIGDIFALIEIIYYILVFIPFPYNILVIACIVLLLFFGRKTYKAKSGFNQLPSFYKQNKSKHPIPAWFKNSYPEFNEQTFLEKAKKAFHQIQDAWMKKDLSMVRKWISDGVYQRFTVQFKMMNILEQSNVMENIQIKEIFIDKIERDGDYFIAHVFIHFTMKDNFVSKKYPALSHGGPLENIEYWSFIRKNGAKECDIYNFNNCPKCGADLPYDKGEVSRCAHCQTITYLGDYDWVLCEITQADDYFNQPQKLSKQGKYTEKIRKALAGHQDFSLQLLEDKASNAFMQIMAAHIHKKPEMMRRFVSDIFYTSEISKINKINYAYNRLYLNTVTLIDLFEANEQYYLVFSLKKTSQRVTINKEFKKLDAAPITENMILVMTKEIKSKIPQGMLYAHSCPNCGGNIADTTEINCQYCGATLNSTAYEWIVDILCNNDYYVNIYKNNFHNKGVTYVYPDTLDVLYDVRDYAFNNVLIMLAADNDFAEEELAFVDKLSKKWGYNREKLNTMLELAKNKQLVLRIPEKEKHKQKMYALMKKAAKLEGSISQQEQAVLDEVKQRLN